MLNIQRQRFEFEKNNSEKMFKLFSDYVKNKKD